MYAVKFIAVKYYFFEKSAVFTNNWLNRRTKTYLFLRPLYNLLYSKEYYLSKRDE